jgi:hypothetical protein
MNQSNEKKVTHVKACNNKNSTILKDYYLIVFYFPQEKQQVFPQALTTCFVFANNKKKQQMDAA